MIDLDVDMPYQEPISFLVKFKFNKQIKNFTIFENGIHEALVLKIKGNDVVLVVNQNEAFRVPASLQPNEDHFIAVVFSDKFVKMYINGSRPIVYYSPRLPYFRDFFPLHESITRFIILMEDVNEIQVKAFYNNNFEDLGGVFHNVLTDFKQ